MTSALRQREAELQNSEAMWHGLVNANPEAVFLMDPTGIVLAANETVAQRLGKDVQGIIGANIFDLLPPETAAERKARLDEVIASGKPVRFEDNRGGRFIDNSIHPIFDSEGKLTRLAVIGIDITERVQAAARAESLAKISRALAGSTFEYQAVLDLAAHSAAELIGDACVIALISDDGEWLQPMAFYHPKPEVAVLLQQIFLSTPSSTRIGMLGAVVQSGEPRLVAVVDQGKFRATVRSEYQPYLDQVGMHSLLIVPLRAQGTIIGTLGLSRDVPGRPYTAEDQMYLQEIAGRIAEAIHNARTNEALKESEERFQNAFEYAAIGKTLVAPDGQFTQVNRAFCEMLGYSEQELLKMTYQDVTHPDDLEADLGYVHQLLAGEIQTYQMEKRYLRKQGQVVWALLSVSLLRGKAGEPRYFISQIQDVTVRKQAEEEIRQLNAELERRVVERTAQLAAARDEAERANRAKSEFLSRMSHELRTPLNAILGFAQLLEMDELAPKHAKGVGHILKAGRHLLDMINEVLDIAHIESGRMSLSLEPVAVGKMAQEVLDLVQPLAAQRHIQLDMRLAQFDQLHVQADRQRLKQVLLNLLSNAVKYNRDRGNVTLAGDAITGNRFRLQVIDTGPGLSPEMLEHIFIPFERLGAEQGSIEGTGLGLALSRCLVELMGGTMGVESVVGAGSTFWVELLIVESQVKQLEQPEPGAPGETPATEQVRTVLCVEDNISNLRLVEQIFARRPAIRLLTAMQGRLALDLAREHHLDLVLLDLNLPDMFGDEVLRWLVAEPRTRAVPVVVISADATAPQIARLMAAGARAYLTKPLDVKQFLQVVDELLGMP